jgi:hypothetical protein
MISFPSGFLIGVLFTRRKEYCFEIWHRRFEYARREFDIGPLFSIGIPAIWIVDACSDANVKRAAGPYAGSL